MKTSHLTRLLALFVALTLAVAAFAGVPQTINYQGYLTTTGGVPASGALAMTFSLYSSNPVRNNPVWREAQPAVAVTNGIYSTRLGSVIPITAPFNVPYWLGVKVAGDPEMPLQALSSVPYAIVAGGIDPGTQTLQTGGAANIGLIVKGAAGQTANLQEWQNDAGTAVATVNPAGDLTLKGNLNLPATTATTGIIKSGGNTLIHTFGSNSNFFAGVLAGNLTMSGTGNVASGYSALYSNTTGKFNTASGNSALRSNTTGDANTANGYYALYLNTTGNYNTASGNSALVLNTTGSNNTANGNSALYSNTTGYSNTASGSSALFFNTTGNYNTASGYYALNSNTTGNSNTASGYSALRSNTTGYSNTASGSSALYSNTTGYSNTSGSLALYPNTTGYYNTASGYRALFSNTTGSNNTAIGYYADVSTDNLTNATAIGYNANVNASNKVRIGNTSVTVIEGQVAWSNPSDIRLKIDVADVHYGLDFIKQLRPVEFRMKEGNGRKDFGFIAQDIETLLGTDYNLLGIGGDAEQTLTLRYTDFIAPLVKAVQEQQAVIEKQNSTIDQLKTEIAEIKKLLGR